MKRNEYMARKGNNVEISFIYHVRENMTDIKSLDICLVCPVSCRNVVYSSTSHLKRKSDENSFPRNI